LKRIKCITLVKIIINILQKTMEWMNRSHTDRNRATKEFTIHVKKKLRWILYIINAAAKTITAADPATVNLFKAAAFAEGPSEGGVEIDDGVTAGETAGESDEAGGGDGGELMADGEGDGEVFTGTGGDATGESAEGEIVGVATGDMVGDEDGDWAMVELTNSVATSINTTV